MRATPRVLLKDYTQPGQLDVDEGSLDRNSSLYLMLQQVGRRKDVLDVGCSSGYLAKLMSSHDCNVSGIEINPEVAEIAKKYCTTVFIADLDFVGLSEAVEGRTFDVIVFGDVLEHLRNPARVLDEARSLLRADGYVVASIPNIAHGAIRLALLRGDFDYKELGILDETHLRFFTLKTVEELFLETGYEIKRIDRTKVDVFDNVSELSAVPYVSRDEFDPETIARMQQDPEFDTLQFVVQALPLSDEDKLRALTKQFIKVNTELAHARNVIDQQQGQLRKTQGQAGSAISESELQARAAEREALAADRDMWRAKVSSELPAAQAEIARLTAQTLDLQHRAAQREAVHAETLTERDHLHDELQQLAEERRALAADRDAWRGQVTTERPAAQAEIARLAAESSAQKQRAADLETELRARAAEREALAADRDAWRTKVNSELAAAQNEIARITADRDRILSELQARAAEREALAADRDAWRTKVNNELAVAQSEIARVTADRDRILSELQARAAEREALVADRDAWRTKINSELAAAQNEITRVTADRDRILSELQERLKEGEAARAEAAAGLEALHRELDAHKEELESVRFERDGASVMARQQALVAQRMQQTVGQSNARIAGLEEELASLSAAMRETHEELVRTQSALRVRDAEVEGAVKHIASLEEQLANLSATMRDTHEEMVRAQSALKARDSEVEGAVAHIRSLEAQLLDQTNLFLASTQAENERLSLLIDTVQSSRFWKLKRILGGLRRALSG